VPLRRAFPIQSYANRIASPHPIGKCGKRGMSLGIDPKRAFADPAAHDCLAPDSVIACHSMISDSRHSPRSRPISWLSVPKRAGLPRRRRAHQGSLHRSRPSRRFRSRKELGICSVDLFVEIWSHQQTKHTNMVICFTRVRHMACACAAHRRARAAMLRLEPVYEARPILPVADAAALTTTSRGSRRGSQVAARTLNRPG
jgi:hypothetical protein